MTPQFQGRPLAVHPPGDYVSDLLRTGAWHEWAIIDAVILRLRALPPGVLVDVGAMIGTWTLPLAALAPHTQVHAFEPLEANRRLLAENAAPYPTVTIHDAALGAWHGGVGMSVEPSNYGHARIDGGPEWVREAPLDSFLLNDVRLLKIDVEGYEAKVLEGARATIQRSRPLIVLEDWGRRYRAMMGWNGYRLAAEWERDHQTFLYEPG